MKIKNGSPAIVFSLGVFIAATNVQASAQGVALKTIANPQNTNQEARNQVALIHEEIVDVNFDNTGVIICIGSLDEIDKNAIPNF